MPGVRAMSSAPVLFRDTQEHRVQYNYDVFEQFPNEELQKFPFVTPAELEKYTTRPKSVRMLARDFVHDSLYNPTYGYFSRQAVLLPEEKTDGDTPLKGKFPFNDIKSETDFMRAVQLRYMAFEKQFQEERERQEKASTQGQPTLKEKIDTLTRRQRRAAWGSAESLELAKEKGRLLEMQSSNSMSESEVDAMAAGQVWHTPTQLFSVRTRANPALLWTCAGALPRHRVQAPSLSLSRPRPVRARRWCGYFGVRCPRLYRGRGA